MADKKVWDENKTSSYHVIGYDKDADVYETICDSPLYDRGIIMAKAILYYHMNISELCRTTTNEPFDWFIISDEKGKTLKVFTTDQPDGFDPETIPE